MSSEIRLLVVDDSAVTRQLITRVVEKDKHIRIVGRAGNGQEALDRIAFLKPDVVTLDVEMPVMDGLETLRQIMKVYPVPVVMLSSLTRHGAHTTMKALELGAVDFLPKPTSEDQVDRLFFELPAKIKLAAAVPLAARSDLDSVQSLPQMVVRWVIKPGSVDVVVFGTSTGGPSALQKVIPRLPADLPAAVLIVQHMPKGFTRALAERLDYNSQISVKEAKDGDYIQNGRALVAPAGQQMYVEKSIHGIRISLRQQADIDTLFVPSVDVTMQSAAEVYGRGVLGVIMTGMGSDGVRGLRKIKSSGGSSIAEAEQTCAVFGMPKAAINANLVDEIHPVERIASAIIRAVGK